MKYHFPRRWLVACFLAGIIVISSASAGAAGEFVSGLEDLPLMPGLVEIDRGGVVFDKPGGRIVEAVAKGRMLADQVHDFYAGTLPQLGWRMLARGRFVREGERLSIRTQKGVENLTVRFSIAPD